MGKKISVLGVRALTSIPRGLRLPFDLGQVIELLWEPRCLHLSLLNNHYPADLRGLFDDQRGIFPVTHQTIIEQARKIYTQRELAVSREQCCMWRYRGIRSKWGREKHQFSVCMKGWGSLQSCLG